MTKKAPGQCSGALLHYAAIIFPTGLYCTLTCNSACKGFCCSPTGIASYTYLGTIVSVASCANAGTDADIAMNPNASRIGSNLTLYPPVGWPDKPIAQPPEERSTGVAVSPKPSDIFLIDQATAAALRFLRQSRSPNAPRPEAKSGSATRFI